MTKRLEICFNYDMIKEKATERARVYPSTYKLVLRLKAKKGKGSSMAEVIDEGVKLLTNIGRYPNKPNDPFMKLMKKAIKSKAKSSV